MLTATVHHSVNLQFTDKQETNSVRQKNNKPIISNSRLETVFSSLLVYEIKARKYEH